MGQDGEAHQVKDARARLDEEAFSRAEMAQTFVNPGTRTGRPGMSSKGD